MLVNNRGYGESLCGRGVRKEFNDGFKGGERTPSPVDGNVREQSMLYFIPLARGGWEVIHGNGKIRFVGELLELALPQTIPQSIGTTTV